LSKSGTVHQCRQWCRRKDAAKGSQRRRQSRCP